MADNADKSDADAGGRGPGDNREQDNGGGLLANTTIVLCGTMLIEAAVLFAGLKFLGGAPKPVLAEATSQSGIAAKPRDKKFVELQVVDFRAPNKTGGRELLFDVSISIEVKADDAPAVKATIADSSDLIQDRVRTIIAEMAPDKLLGASDPGLATLKRSVKYELDEIVGDGVIEEVLVSRCIPVSTDD